MDRTTRVFSRCCKIDRLSPILLSGCLRYLGIHADNGRAVPLKKVDPDEAGLRKVSSSRLVDARPQSIRMCSACTVKSDNSVRSGNFWPSIHPVSRWFSTASQMLQRIKPEEVKKRMEDLTDRFAEARELLGDAVCYQSFCVVLLYVG